MTLTTRRTPLLYVWAGGWAVALAACSDPEVCSLEAILAVQIEVRNAATEEYIAGLVRGVVTDGAYQDSLRAGGPIGSDPALVTTLGAAEERPGNYAVHLEGPGFEDWDTAGVRVTRNECHVNPARFTARLQPSPETGAASWTGS